MEYDYPEQCFFCRSRIGSQHCLLPFELIKEYTAPEDALSAITDITEIHMHYSIPALKSNFELIHWVSVRPTADEISEYSNSVRSRTSGWFETQQSIKEDMEQRTAKYVEATCQTEAPNRESEATSWSDEIQESETYAGKVKSNETKNQIDLVPEHLKGQEIEESSKRNIDEKKDHSLILQKEEAETEKKTEQKRKMNQDEEIHLMSDLVLAAKAAHKLHLLGRSVVKTSQLIEHMITEIGLRNAYGINYRASTNTSLDGTKSISKEIIGGHDELSIRQWESSKSIEMHKYCILNFKAFQASKIGMESDYLTDDLTRYFGKVEDSFINNDGTLKRILNSIMFEFERQSEPETYPWIKTRVRYLKLKDSNVKKLSTEEGKERVHTVLKYNKEPYPAIDSRLLEFIDSHLQKFVNKAIEDANGRVPTMKDETKVEIFIRKLAIEFLKRNKGWQNENSFSLPRHLTKIEDSTGIHSQPNESFITFSILKNTLDEFRKAFKERY